MRTLEQQLTNYASYHRDRRNIATHFFGIPMIVVGVAAFLARPTLLNAGDLAITPVWFVTALSLLYYYLLDLRFGLVMTLFMGGALAAGSSLAAQSTTVWLTGASILFVLGWFIQFVGHYFEQKKPAFVDDVSGFLIGPLFVVAEAGFALGLRKPVQHSIEEAVGPTLIRERRTATPR